MRKTNRKPYAGYKRAHLYSAIGTIVLGLCLIIAVIIMAVNFRVEIKVEQQPTITTEPVQQQQNVAEDTKGSTEDPQIEEVPAEEIPAVEEITPTEEPTAEEIIPIEETPVEEPTTPEVAEPVTEEPTIEEPAIAEPTTEEAEVEIVTVLVTVNFYNNGCTTKTIEIRAEANTILTKADIKNLVAEQYPAWGRVSSTGLPTEFTATDGAKVPGIVKLYLV